MKKTILLSLIALVALASYADNKIYYTTSDGNTIKPFYTNFGEGIKVVSNTYENGQGVMTFNGDIKMLGGGCFAMHNTLTSITLPNSVDSIATSAIQDCPALESIYIPKSVKAIGVYAFPNCPALTKITIDSSNPYYMSENGKVVYTKNKDNLLMTVPTFEGSYNIPNTVKTISVQAFNNTGITSVTIPNSVTDIGNNAFLNCTGLSSVVIPNSVKNIGKFAFQDCSNLTSVTIGNAVESIGYYAFQNCSKLNSIVFPNSVENLGFGVCSGCTNLKSATLSESLNAIGAGSFEGCSNLTSITIPATVETIGNKAFYGCTNIKSIYAKPITPPLFGTDAIYGIDKKACIVYVPDNPTTAFTRYSGANIWNEFYNIEAVDFSADTQYVLARKQCDSNIDGQVNGADVVRIYNFIVNGQ